MSEHHSVLMTIIDHVFPKSADFFRLLTEQSVQVTRTVAALVEFMETADPAIGQEIRKDEHDADAIKVRNIHTLNEAFSTPIDREDIYRAITDLDEIVNYCKSTVNEMDILGLQPDHFTLEMSKLLKDGVDVLANGFSKLGVNPASAAVAGYQIVEIGADPTGRIDLGDLRTQLTKLGNPAYQTGSQRNIRQIQLQRRNIRTI